MDKNNIYIGTIDEEPYKINIRNEELPEKSNIAKSPISTHTFITGMSGSGKSYFLRRYIEEILVREVGNVIFFDYNDEFSNIRDFNEKSVQKYIETSEKKFSADRVSEIRSDNEEEFQKEWEKISDKFLTIRAAGDKDKISINYNDLDLNQKALLFEIDNQQNASAYWLIKLLDEYEKINSELSLEEFIKNFSRWSELRLRENEQNLKELLIKINQNVDKINLISFINGANRLLTQNYIITPDKKDKIPSLSQDFFNRFFSNLDSESKLSYCAIDLLNFNYDDYLYRDFTAFYSLKCLWLAAKENYRKNKNVKENIFIVIDEAHNIIPNNQEVTSEISREITKLIKTIAAEGRKFGLRLVLISQRPDKIDNNVISECDNFIIMKSPPPTIDMVKKLLPIFEHDKSNLQQAFNFKAGDIFVCGKLSKYKLTRIKGYSFERTG